MYSSSTTALSKCDANEVPEKEIADVGNFYVAANGQKSAGSRRGNRKL